MRDRVKEPRQWDVWSKNGIGVYVREEEPTERNVLMFVKANYTPAIVLPLDVAMQIQAEYSAKLLSAEIDGITSYSRGVRRIVDALETATGEKVGVRI